MMGSHIVGLIIVISLQIFKLLLYIVDFGLSILGCLHFLIGLGHPEMDFIEGCMAL